MIEGKLWLRWLYARRAVLLYIAAVFAIFFIVYGLYGYGWGVAGYAALVAFSLGLGLAARDFIRFASRHAALSRAVKTRPVEGLPEADSLLEQDYTDIIMALERQRDGLERENEHARRDAEEYYTLWTHQVKTPIAAMRLLLQRGDARPSTHEKIEQELFRISQYVDMALQYQRLSSLQSDLLLENHPLEELVKKAVKSCAPLFIYKGLALDMAQVSGTLITDEKWFCFALEQLLTNAVKYTRQGTVRVYTPDADTLVVEDTGCGIPPEDLPRVFERGFTGAAGRAERSSTGIGLYLCRRILTHLGFGISIESSPGQGTRVLLHIKQQALELE